MTALTPVGRNVDQIDGLAAAANSLSALLAAEGQAWSQWATMVRRPLIGALARLGVADHDAEGVVRQLTAAMHESAGRITVAAQELDSIQHAVAWILELANTPQLPAKVTTLPTGIS